MSLFPAYDQIKLQSQNQAENAGAGGGNEDDNLPSTSKSAATPTVSASSEQSKWLNNKTFIFSKQYPTGPFFPSETILIDSDEEREKSKKLKHKKYMKHHYSSSTRRSKKEKRKEKEKLKEEVKLEFSVNEKFEVAKAPHWGHRSVRTLHKPYKPNYYCYFKKLNDRASLSAAYCAPLKQNERYYWRKTWLDYRIMVDDNKKLNANQLEEKRASIMGRIHFLNTQIRKQPEVMANWLELYELNNLNMNKYGKLALAENQLYFLKSGLYFHPASEDLIALYIKVANDNYASDHVSFLFNSLLEEYPYNYSLWTAQVMVIQGRMLNFNVDGVLRVYEKFMGNMQRYPPNLMRHLKLLQQEQLQREEILKEEILKQQALEGNKNELAEEEKRNHHLAVASALLLQKQQESEELEKRSKAANEALIRMEEQRDPTARPYWKLDMRPEDPPAPPKKRKILRIRHADSEESSASEYEEDEEDPTSDFEQNSEFDEHEPPPAYVANEVGGDGNAEREGEGQQEQQQEEDEQENDDVTNQTDAVMLQLFHNCALFLRQCGQYERFYALLRLALHTNMLINFDNFIAKAENEKYLSDYEDLVIYSGLPLNEIWLRYEKLKQSYAYLPIVPSLYYNEPDEDDDDDEFEGEEKTPFRCVFNEEVGSYIYPLRSEYYMLHLILLTIQLTKLPFVTSHCLAEELSPGAEKVGDLDSMEMLLATAGERLTYALWKSNENRYLKVISDMAKELAVNPTFISNNIGSELYVRCLSELLINSDSAYRSMEKSTKYRLFLVLWFRFERLRLVLDKMNGKVDEEYIRDSRARVSSLVEHDNNRYDISLYTEMGIYEYEIFNVSDMKDSFHPQNAFQVFEYALTFQTNDPTRFENAEFWYAHVIYTELLIAKNNRLEALRQLINFILCKTSARKVSITHATGLIALQRLEINIQDIIEVTQKEEMRKSGVTDHFPLEAYFVPNRVVLMIRAFCLLLCLLNIHGQAITFIDDLLSKKYPKEKQTKRNLFMREKLYEILIITMQIPKDGHSQEAQNSLLIGPMLCRLKEALEEFPRNLHFLQRWSRVSSVSWLKLRSDILEVKSNILPILYLAVSARWRYFQGNSEEHNLIMVNTRIYNLLHAFSPSNKYRLKRHVARFDYLKKNALYWRLLMRTLANRSRSFQSIKETLYLALDDCPWNKAIYLDGATFVPEEAPRLNDTMVETLVRVAMTFEELDIMRNTAQEERHKLRKDDWKKIDKKNKKKESDNEYVDEPNYENEPEYEDESEYENESEYEDENEPECEDEPEYIDQPEYEDEPKHLYGLENVNEQEYENEPEYMEVDELSNQNKSENEDDSQNKEKTKNKDKSKKKDKSKNKDKSKDKEKKAKSKEKKSKNKEKKSQSREKSSKIKNKSKNKNKS